MNAVRIAGVSLGLALLAACSPAAKSVGAVGTPLERAFQAAYGAPAPYTTLDDSGDHVTYSPQAIEEVAPGVVALIAKGEIEGGCRACGGALSIFYLKHDASGFVRQGSWPDIGGKGEFGKALPWTIRTDIDDGPTLVTTRQQMDPSCSATLQELITLRPKAPVKIATVVTASALASETDGGVGPHVEGKIAPLERGQRFVVELSGTDPARQVYTRQGDVFTTMDGGATGC